MATIDAYGLFLFAKDEAVVEEKIEDHNNDGGEDKGTGSENEFIGKWKMYGASNIMSEFVEWGKEAKKLSKSWCDGDGKNSIPNKESDDGVFSDGTFFPGDF